jgi:ferredoxin-NADP reductase
VHLGLAALRRHRSQRTALVSLFVLPSFLLAGAPWLWSSGVGLAAGMALHLGWFVVCELMTPAPSAAAASPVPRRAGAAAATPPASGPASRAPAPAADAGSAFVTTAVLAVLEEANGIKTFRLARPHGFEFSPGQFIAVRVQVNGKPHVRCYSISSSPDTRGYLEISVRRQGLVSTTLHATLRTGALATINRPAGRFVYPGGDDRPLVLIAGGIGITPLMSMLRYGVSADPARPIVLLYSVRREEDVAYLGELRVIAERHPGVRVAVSVTQPSGNSRWRRGRVDIDLIRQYVPHPGYSVFCVCGPVPMIAAAERMLREADVPADQIRSEQFDLAAAATVLNSASATPQRDAAETRARTVSFTISGRSVSNPASRSLLEAAEAEGVAIASSCRAGVCQACRTRVVAGDVDCRSDVLHPDDRAAGFVLPCVSFASADCALEA